VIVPTKSESVKTSTDDVYIRNCQIKKTEKSGISLNSVSLKLKRNPGQKLYKGTQQLKLDRHARVNFQMNLTKHIGVNLVY
jgi:hypothetical protein